MKKAKRIIIRFLKIMPAAVIIMLLLVITPGIIRAEDKYVQDISDATEKELLFFETSDFDYVLSTENDNAKTTKIDGLNVKKGQAEDKGRISYYIKDDAKELGIKIDNKTGRLTVGKVGLLIDKLTETNEDGISFKVWADKEKYGEYAKANASYTVNIRLDRIFEDAYILTDSDGNEIIADKDKWYNTPIMVWPFDSENYSIAGKKNIADIIFSDSAVIDSQGENINEGIYLRNKSTGRISYVPVTEIIKIDTIEPEIDFEYKSDEQKAVINIKEKNFEAGSIKYISKSEDINGNELIVNDDKICAYLQNADNWSVKDDTYTADISKLLTDGIYKSISISCEDKAGNKSEKIYAPKDRFVVDHIPPDISDMTIEYSEPIIKEGDSSFYNKSGAVITFTARDEISGISAFEWAYVREENAGASNISDVDYKRISFVQDKNDKSKYIAILKLPENETDQMRGYISFKTNDGCGNTSKEYRNKKTIVIIDSKAPSFRNELSDEPVAAVKNRRYYNQSCVVTFEIEETNFDKNAVKIACSKDYGKSFTDISSQVVWDDTNVELHEGSYRIAAGADHRGDGEYIFKAEYTDKSGNKMDMHISDQIYIIDTTQPVIEVSYLNNDEKNRLTDSNGHERKYFNSTQTAVIIVNEKNFNGADINILAEDINGASLNNRYSISKWTADENDENLHRAIITYDGEANFTFDMICTDIASNSIKYGTDYFTVDMAAPSDFTIICSPAVLDTDIKGTAYGFYKSNMTVTVSASDDISGIDSFIYCAEGDDSIELINQEADESDTDFFKSSKSASFTFEIPIEKLTENNQFNGVVKIRANDRSGNASEENTASKRIVVDNIAPSASITYNAPVNSSENISYYDGNINAILRINEANFFAEDVKIKVFKDGMPYETIPAWSDAGIYEHIGCFSLSEDGSYTIRISYTDKSGNSMYEYLSGNLEIDTKLEEPIVLINGEDGNKRAYKDEVIPYISFNDKNLEDYSIRLTRTRLNEKDKDVTDEFIGSDILTDQNCAQVSIDSLRKSQDVDGIYKLSVEITDKACHKAVKSIVFTVNRYGSVYEYSDYLNNLIKNGGAYVKKLTGDLVITEYNADKLLEGSLKIDISRDGRLIDNAVFESEPILNDEAEVGESGWYQYSYRISRENFLTDGIYKIAVSSEDKTGNLPETTNYDDKNILFRIDSTAPEISSIKGIEDSIINAYEAEVVYTIYDAIGLDSIQVLLDDRQIDNITDFGGDTNNYKGSFIISESTLKQNVRLIVKDKAGNITDTSDKDFVSECTYRFNEWVTVSSNPAVRALAWVRTNILKTVILALSIAAFLIVFAFFIKRHLKREA